MDKIKPCYLEGRRERRDEGARERGDENTPAVDGNLAPSPSRPLALTHLCLLNHPWPLNAACLTTPLNSIFWSGFALEIKFKIKINNRWCFSQ